MEIGVVGRPHGIRGEIRVHLYNPASPALEVLDAVLVRRRDAEGRPAAAALRLGIERVHPGPDGSWIVALAGVVTRDDAETLRGASLSAKRSELPALEADEVYAEDLPGLEALDPDGRPLGRVRDVYSNGAQEVLVVATPEREIEVPFVDAYVGAVDLQARTIVIRDLDALIPGP